MYTAGHPRFDSLPKGSHFSDSPRAKLWEPNSENCLHLIFYEKVIVVPDTNYTTTAIRKFTLDMPGPGSFQNIGVLI